MGRTVLIVDDQRMFRATARALLESDGFEVVGEARDGGDGLGAERALRPQLVLVDVRLPDMDGFDVAAAIAGRDDPPEVVVISSSDDPLYPERARRSGARGFLSKHDLAGPALTRLLAA